MLTAFLWGGLVRVFLLHHVTFSINSLCHFFGRRPYDTRERSTNVWPLALLSFGESWHNNHHAFPASAFLGLRAWQLDPGAWLLRLLAAAGLARDLKQPTREEVVAERRAA
jgi:stearoyl-CoA desaturase (delta-9 desaturase)